MEGLLGLRQNINTAESGMRELGVLERMDQRIQTDRNAEVLAQQQEQLMFEQMYEKAGTFLEKDRKNMNKRIAKSQATLRNHLASTGGSRKDFMEQGGIAVMNDIKNGIMRSDEAITMNENQKNLAKILEADAKGLGHLISPNDRRSVEQYNEMESGGKISFNGMMAEITIPKGDGFDYGTQIPLANIMSHESNMMKLIHNYAIAHPDSHKLDPYNRMEDRLALIHFAKEMGYGGVGTNTINIGEENRRRKAYNNKSNTESYYSWVAQANDVTASVRTNLQIKDIMAGGEYEGGVMNSLYKTNPTSKMLFSEKSKLVAKNRSASEAGSLWNRKGPSSIEPGSYVKEGFGEVWDKFFADDVGLKDSYEFMPLSKMDIAQLLYPAANADGTKPGYIYENGMLSEWEPNEKVFRSDGTKLVGQNKPKSGQLKGQYKIKGTYTALKQKAGSDDGEDSLLIDVYDSDGKVNKTKTAEIDKMVAGKNGGSGIQMTYVMALEAEDGGDLYYQEIDISSPQMRAILGEAVGTTANSGFAKEARADNDINAIQARTQQITDQTQSQWNTDMRELDDAKVWEGAIQQQGQKYWGANSGGALNRNALMKSMYMALDYQLNAGKNPDQQGIHSSTVKSLIDKGRFDENMQLAFGKETGKVLRDYSGQETDIVDHWFNEIVEVNSYSPNSENYKQNLQLASVWKKILEMQNQQGN